MSEPITVTFTADEVALRAARAGRAVRVCLEAERCGVKLTKEQITRLSRMSDRDAQGQLKRIIMGTGQ